MPHSLALAACCLGLASAVHAGAPLRMNDIVAVGTHNSYKQAMPAETMARLRMADPAAADALDYAHRPLVEQLDRGARQLELDVNFDPHGGHYAAGSDDPAFGLPGFKVLHIPGIDDATHCVRLVACLETIRDWSDANPGHVPILLMFNAKDERNAARGGIDALPFTEAAFDALDAEIRSVLPPEKLIVPDDVQGDFPTLREAVLAGNWPSLEAARGRVLFALDEGPAKVALYRGARRSLEGRVFFVNTDEDSPAAAYLTLNDPVADGERIARAVRAGFLVRTRADAETREARQDDTRRRDAALASGAQYVSTDYLWPEPRLSPRYEVRLPGGAPAACNPVRRPAGCDAAGLEPQAR
ncbi:phosphatidylinositol-specific phospholipase C1-like protein [Coralloluteibacterium thermophilus]|uniref:Phosphatidylinositol-specific phospholipase C1-like protein n=1 Tax=Coralloluteibacterium thermophilum TaxID=2707049 RepID=A0ABV9NEY5_9GAMM